jgi:hypothetical protein
MFEAIDDISRTELASRETNGITVRLLWSRSTNLVTVAVDDAANDDYFELVLDERRAGAGCVPPSVCARSGRGSISARVGRELLLERVVMSSLATSSSFRFARVRGASLTRARHRLRSRRRRPRVGHGAVVTDSPRLRAGHRVVGRPTMARLELAVAGSARGTRRPAARARCGRLHGGRLTGKSSRRC